MLVDHRSKTRAGIGKKFEDPRDTSRPRLFVMLTVRIFVKNEVIAYLIGIVLLTQIDHFTAASCGSLLDLLVMKATGPNETPVDVELWAPKRIRERVLYSNHKLRFFERSIRQRFNDRVIFRVIDSNPK